VIPVRATTLALMLFDERGAALVEYALVLALLSMGAVVALGAFGGTATTALQNNGTALTNTGRTPP
jgi:Flp pilus assembly pilin Flp